MKLLIQLRLHVSIRNNFDYFEVHIPFFNRYDCYFVSLGSGQSSAGIVYMVYSANLRTLLGIMVSGLSQTTHRDILASPLVHITLLGHSLQ